MLMSELKLEYKCGCILTMPCEIHKSGLAKGTYFLTLRANQEIVPCKEHKAEADAQH